MVNGLPQSTFAPAAHCLLPAASWLSGFTDLFFFLLLNADSEVGTAYFTPSTAYAEFRFGNLRLPFFIHCQDLFRAKRRTDATPFAPVPIELHLKPFFLGFGLGLLILDLCLLSHFAFRGLCLRFVFVWPFAVIPTPVTVSIVGLENTQFEMVFQTVSRSVSPENH